MAPEGGAHPVDPATPTDSEWRRMVLAPPSSRRSVDELGGDHGALPARYIQRSGDGRDIPERNWLCAKREPEEDTRGFSGLSSGPDRATAAPDEPGACVQAIVGRLLYWSALGRARMRPGGGRLLRGAVGRRRSNTGRGTAVRNGTPATVSAFGGGVGDVGRTGSMPATMMGRRQQRAREATAGPTRARIFEAAASMGLRPPLRFRGRCSGRATRRRWLGLGSRSAGANRLAVRWAWSISARKPPPGALAELYRNYGIDCQTRFVGRRAQNGFAPGRPVRG